MDSQLSLLGDSQPLTRHERVDGKTVFNDFTKAVKAAGGSNKAYPQAVRAETQALFDCGVDQLYEETGAKKGHRSTLPKEAQKAYMVSEALSTHQLNQELKGKNQGSQRQKDKRIVDNVQETANTVRKWLPW